MGAGLGANLVGKAVVPDGLKISQVSESFDHVKGTPQAGEIASFGHSTKVAVVIGDPKAFDGSMFKLAFSTDPSEMMSEGIRPFRGSGVKATTLDS